MTTRTLWAATVRTKSFPERAQAALAGGFSTMSAFPLDIRTWEQTGQTIAQLRELLAQHALRLTILDPFVQWTPQFALPADLSATDRAFVDFDETEFFRMATELGVDKLSVIESFGQRHTVAEFATAFGRVCDRAATLGMKVQLEFMPFSGIPDLETAWDIVRTADRPNGGLVFDTWHYFRGKPDNALLRTIPGEKIYAVQVADAVWSIQGGSLLNDLLHYRLEPGRGEFPLVEVSAVLRGIGGLSDVGPELFSDVFDGLPAEEAGKRAGDSLRRVLEPE